MVIENRYRQTFDGLNPFQQQVAFLAGQGYSNKEISKETKRATSTVKNSLTPIIAIFDAGNRYGLATRLVQADVIDPRQFIEDKKLSGVTFDGLSRNDRTYMATLAGLDEGDSLPLSNKVIAQRARIKEQTVKNALVSIRLKLGLPWVDRVVLIMLTLAHQEEFKAA